MSRLPRSLRFVAAALALVGAVAIVRSGTPTLAAGLQQPSGLHHKKVLITFRGRPGQAEEAAVRAAGGTISHTFHLVPVVAADLTDAAIATLQRHPSVAMVEDDGPIHALDITSELNNSWGVKQIGAGTVHAAGIRGSGVIVGIMDTGIDPTHPDLAPNYAAGLSFNYIDPTQAPIDDNSHGSHVAGIIGAVEDGNGVVGVAPDATLAIFKVLDGTGNGDWSNVIAALELAVSEHVQVMNSSFGDSTAPATAVQAAYAAAEQAGMVNVAAAGNDGTCKGRGDNIEWPARYSSVIAVGATDPTNARACFSSTGPLLALVAPGVLVNSTIPVTDGSYAAFTGTSMASPHVAGVAALMMSAGVTDVNHNGRVNDEVQGILQSTAQDLGARQRDDLYGFGLVNAVAAVAAAGGTSATTTSSVATVTYATSGAHGKNLVITATVVDGSNRPVNGATVAIAVSRNGSTYGTSSGTTNRTGVVSFQLANAPSGTYITTITSVVASGLSWDGITPVNTFTK